MTNKHCLDMKLFAAILLLLAVYVSAPAKVTGYALSTGHGHNDDPTAYAVKMAVRRNKRTNHVANLVVYADKRAVRRNKRANPVADLVVYAEKRAVRRDKRTNPVADLVAYAANRAVQKLLAGTTQTGDGNLLRTYIKYAKNKQYLKDFDSLRPTNVYEKTWKNGVIDRTGEVGDKIVFTTTNGPNRIPILEIQSYTKVDQIIIPTIDRITYIE